MPRSAAVSERPAAARYESRGARRVPAFLALEGAAAGTAHCCAHSRAPVAVSRCTAAAREGGCARGCESHPSNWTVHDGTARCLSPRKGARGVSSPGIEPMGLNEDEPQLMSLVMTYHRSRRVPGAWMKADAGSADNRQPLPSPAGSAWQARREGQPQIKGGEGSR